MRTLFGLLCCVAAMCGCDSAAITPPAPQRLYSHNRAELFVARVESLSGLNGGLLCRIYWLDAAKPSNNRQVDETYWITKPGEMKEVSIGKGIKPQVGDLVIVVGSYRLSSKPSDFDMVRVDERTFIGNMPLQPHPSEVMVRARGKSIHLEGNLTFLHTPQGSADAPKSWRIPFAGNMVPAAGNITTDPNLMHCYADMRGQYEVRMVFDYSIPIGTKVICRYEAESDWEYTVLCQL